MTTTILLLIVVILFSALFSGMEIAFVSSNKLLHGIDRNEDSLTSGIINKFYDNSNNFISSLLVGNNIVLVIYGILMAKLLNATALSGLSDNEGVRLLLETIVSTIVIIFTGEFIPGYELACEDYDDGRYYCLQQQSYSLVIRQARKCCRIQQLRHQYTVDDKHDVVAYKQARDEVVAVVIELVYDARCQRVFIAVNAVQELVR